VELGKPSIRPLFEYFWPTQLEWLKETGEQTMRVHPEDLSPSILVSFLREGMDLRESLQLRATGMRRFGRPKISGGLTTAGCPQFAMDSGRIRADWCVLLTGTIEDRTQSGWRDWSRMQSDVPPT